jgi:hypothetical protein
MVGRKQLSHVKQEAEVVGANKFAASLQQLHEVRLRGLHDSDLPRWWCSKPTSPWGLLSQTAACVRADPAGAKRPRSLAQVVLGEGQPRSGRVRAPRGARPIAEPSSARSKPARSAPGPSPRPFLGEGQPRSGRVRAPAGSSPHRTGSRSNNDPLARIGRGGRTSMSQRSGRLRPYRGMKSSSLFSPRQKAAIRRMVASMSSVDTTSLGECM